MEFCNDERITGVTGVTGITTDTTRGLYPAPDSDTTDTTTAPAAPRRLRRASAAAEVQAMTATPAPTLTPLGTTTATTTAASNSVLCVIEPNADIAEGLQHLLHTIPGVATVIARATSADLLHDVALRTSATTDADVTAYAGATLIPDIVLLDTGKECGPNARSWTQVRESMLEVQRALPSTALVLMSVYPERMPESVRSLATASIRKDTTRQELAALIEHVRSSRTQRDALADAASA